MPPICRPRLHPDALEMRPRPPQPDCSHAEYRGVLLGFRACYFAGHDRARTRE